MARWRMSATMSTCVTTTLVDIQTRYGVKELCKNAPKPLDSIERLLNICINIRRCICNLVPSRTSIDTSVRCHQTYLTSSVFYDVWVFKKNGVAQNVFINTIFRMWWILADRTNSSNPTWNTYFRFSNIMPHTMSLIMVSTSVTVKCSKKSHYLTRVNCNVELWCLLVVSLDKLLNNQSNCRRFNTPWCASRDATL